MKAFITSILAAGLSASTFGGELPIVTGVPGGLGMPRPIAPNTYLCEGEVAKASYIHGELKVTGMSLSGQLTEPHVQNTEMGQLVSALLRGIADINISYTLILPNVLLANTNDTQEFTTQLVSSRSGGFAGPILAGASVKNDFAEVTCVASHTAKEVEIYEDAERVLQAQTDWINVMPGPGLRVERKTVGLDLVAEVISSGCTKADDFKVEIVANEDGSQALSIERTRQDVCRVLSHPIKVKLRAEGYNFSELTYKGVVVPVERRLAH